MSDILDLAARHCCSYGKDGNDFVFDKTQLLAFVADLATHAGAAAAEPGQIYWHNPENGQVWSETDVRFHCKDTSRWTRVVIPAAALTSAPAVPEAMHHTCEESSECLLCDAHAKRHQFEAEAATFGLDVLRITAQPDSPYWKIETQFAWECWTRSQLKGVQPGERGEG